MTRYFYVNAKYKFSYEDRDRTVYPKNWRWKDETKDACMVVSPFGGMYIATFDGNEPKVFARVNPNKNGDYYTMIAFNSRANFLDAEGNIKVDVTELEDVPMAVKAGLYHAYHCDKYPHYFEPDVKAWEATL